MFSNVLVGYDGSSQAHDALSLAAAFTGPRGSVTACCVHGPQTHRLTTVAGRIDRTEPGLGRTDAMRCAECARDLLSGPVRTDALVLEAASAAAGLQDVARRRAADLLVLGSSHRGRLGQVALGSVAVEALHEPPCPVAVANCGARTAAGGMRIASIAVGCDVVDDPGPELQVAVDLAAGLGATLHVIAVADTRVPLAVEYGGAVAYPAVLRARRLAAEEGLTTVLADLRRDVSVTGEVREGNPTEKLAEVSHGVDLLVLGIHHYRPLDRLLGRSVATSLTRHSYCPVLAVPQLTGERAIARAMPSA